MTLVRVGDSQVRVMRVLVNGEQWWTDTRRTTARRDLGELVNALRSKHVVNDNWMVLSA